MSAFQRAVLSVAPDRLEQFTAKMKKNINEKENGKQCSDRSGDAGSVGRGSKRRAKKSSRHKGAKKLRLSSPVEPRRKKAKKRRKYDEKASSGTSSIKRKRIGEKHKKSEDDFEYNPLDLDLSISFLPLNNMVKDRKALLDTAFSIIQGPKLTSILPDILKLTSLQEIKQMCREQLNVISSKRLLHILAGTKIESSSGTDSSNDDEQVRKAVAADRPPQMEDGGSSLDRRLQANLIDSTTSDNFGPSILFPSALGTAHGIAEGGSQTSQTILSNQNDVDNVSTSTEPSVVYQTEDGNLALCSDTEEGEVLSSPAESGSEEQDVEVPEEHPNEEVTVEVEEEIEEIHDGEHSKSASFEQESVEEEISSKIEDSLESAEYKEMEVQDSTQDGVAKPKTSESNTTTTVPHNPSEDDPTCCDSYRGKSQLEILELELRARAIRSLMNASKLEKLKLSKD